MRVKKSAGYAQIYNKALQDSSISFEARGVLAYLMSKPDDWEVKPHDIQKSGNIGKHKYDRIMKELQSAGYVKRWKYQQENGRWKWESVVTDDPSIEPQSGFPPAGEPTTVEPTTENPTIYKERLTNKDLQIEEEIVSSPDLNPNTRYDGVKTLPPTKGDAENKAYNLLMVACDEIKCDLSKKKDVDYLRVLYNLLPSDNTQAVQAIKDFVSWWLDEEKKGKPPTVGQVAGFWAQFKEWRVESVTTYHLLKPLTELKRKDSTAAVNLLRSDDYKTVKAIMKTNNIGDIRALEYETEESWKAKEKKYTKSL